MQKPELLLPAGSFEKLQYAIAYGADAVYLGIPMFSLRARGNGFQKESVAEAIEYAHARGKKVYLTANILPHNHKVNPFIKYIDRLLSECQPDAWIMSDPGMIMLMRERHPEQEIHLSVQANTVNYATARFWHRQGVKRIILSRELSIKEIRQIKEECPDLELEAFVHGAICIAYSGRCLISNYMSYRDPNQGTCSHSCRWQYRMYEKSALQPQAIGQSPQNAQAVTQHGDAYHALAGDFYLEELERPGEYMPIDEDENGTYLMNARDLCAIEYLQELRDAGVDSFKVEGRNKSVYYVAHIARAYRRAIDDMVAGKALNESHWRDVFAVANKGYIAGFYKGNPGKSAQKYDGTKAENPAYRFAGIIREYDADRKMVKVEPRNPLYPGQELELVTPQATTPFKVEKLYNVEFEEIDMIHGGLHYCWIPWDEEFAGFGLLREKTEG